MIALINISKPPQAIGTFPGGRADFAGKILPSATYGHMK